MRKKFFNRRNAAKMFVITVNVKNSVAKFIREGVDNFNCGGIHAHIVKNIAGYRQKVGLSVGNALQKTFETFQREIRAQMQIANLRESEAF